MKTAGLIKISRDVGIRNVVVYNMQKNKTTGPWRQNYGFTQEDLIDFTDVARIPNSSKDEQARAFIRQAKYNVNIHLAINPHNRNGYNMITIIQSFDFDSNRYLQPETVHAMGLIFYSRLKKYLLIRYNYNLDGAMISTHIDDDQPGLREGPKYKRGVWPHLHSHIVIPAFNSKGQPFYPYLRKADIYKLQTINNSIVSSLELNDYYFNQILHLRQPISIRTLRRHERSQKTKSFGTSLPKF